MIFKIKGFFLITFLILLQSCSGGKIGNFLESSFDNLEKNENKKNNNKQKNKIPETFSVDKKVSSLENRENKINNNKQKNNKQKNNKQKKYDILSLIGKNTLFLYIIHMPIIYIIIKYMFKN